MTKRREKAVMLNELDVVALTVDIPSDGLMTKNVGTIVQLYSPDPYEVEFVDNDGQTYGLVTLSREQIMRLQFSPVAAA